MSELEMHCDIAIAKYKLFQKNDKLLLACSGGKDSVALLHYLVHKGYSLEVAHVNYQLREEADADEEHVKMLCRRHNLPFHVHRVEKSSIPRSNIQEWARNVRYDFFDSILDESPLQYLLTAHSLNDFTESILMHMAKGRNLRHNAGIAFKYGRIRRPLLLSSSTEIYAYLDLHQIPYRTDISNHTDKYERNRVRHKLIPAYHSIFPDLFKGMRRFIDTTVLHNSLAIHGYNHLKSKVLSRRGNVEIISLDEGYSRNVIRAFLYEHLLNFQFHPDQINQLLVASTGKIIRSEEYEALKNRQEIHLRKQKKMNDTPSEVLIYYPDSTDTQTYRIGEFEFTIKEGKASVDCRAKAENVVLYNRQFPLHIRKWRAGDRFQPLGMSGHVKVKKFLTDLKLSLWKKEETQVLVDAEGKILWLIPYRISEMIKCEPELDPSDTFTFLWKEVKDS